MTALWEAVIVFLLIGQLAVLGGIFFRLGRGAAFIEQIRADVSELFNRLLEVERGLQSFVNGKD